MFSLFKLLLGSKDASKTPSNKGKSAPSINIELFEDMILLMVGLTLFFLMLTVMRYTCFNRASNACERCTLVQAMRELNGNVGNSKRSMFNHNEQVNQFAAGTGEDFV